MAPFYKLSGAGNDFIALAEPLPAGLELTPATIRTWCTRRLSLGADGLFLLAPRPDDSPGPPAGPAGDAPATVRMIHYNADGTRADLCINGTRCAARLAWELGWARGDRLTVVTDAGPIPARRVSADGPDGPIEADTIALELPAPTGVETLSLSVDGRACSGYLVAAGVPHFVLPWRACQEGEDDAATTGSEPGATPGLDRAPVATLGPVLRHHPDLGPGGANVDFVRVAGRHRIEIRSYERGVEGETLACGTGVLAAVAAGCASGALEPPVTALTRGGFALRVATGERTDCLELSGDARLVARGELLSAATALPAPPDWQ